MPIEDPAWGGGGCGVGDEPGFEELRGLPAAAVERVRHQRASGVRGSLLSAPAAAAIRSAGLEPVGEVFGCIVVGFGWTGGPCGYAYGWNTTFGGGPVGGGWSGGGWSGGVPGTVGGGIAGGTSRDRRTWSNGLGYVPETPVVVSGDMTASRYAWALSFAQAVERALGEAHRRMLAEARALGADGVLGITRSVTRLDGQVEEYATLGTAVRSVDRALARPPASAPWAATLTGEDCAAAAAAGYTPAGVAFGYSLASKHEDWLLRQQRSSWTNQEVAGLTELLSAARGDARRSLDRQARKAARDGGEVVVTDTALRTFERACTGDQKDVLAEALFVGTVLTPHPAGPARRAGTLTVLPLTPPTAPARRRP